MKQALDIFPAADGSGIDAVRFATPGLDLPRLRVARRLVHVGEFSRMRAWLHDVSGAAWVSTREFAVRHLERSGAQQPIPRGMRIFLGHE